MPPAPDLSFDSTTVVFRSRLVGCLGYEYAPPHPFMRRCYVKSQTEPQRLRE